MGIELMTSSLPRMRSTPELHRLTVCLGAENEVRTRDPQLGRLMLYQLSYFRKILRILRVSWRRLGKENKFYFSLGLHKNSALIPSLGPSKIVGGGGLEPPNPEGADLQSAAIATMRTSHWLFNISKLFRADRGIRTHDPEITNHVLWPTELYRRSRLQR